MCDVFCSGSPGLIEEEVAVVPGSEVKPDALQPSVSGLRHPEVALKLNTDVILVPLTQGKWILEVFQGAETRWSRPPKTAPRNLKGSD